MDLYSQPSPGRHYRAHLRPTGLRRYWQRYLPGPRRECAASWRNRTEHVQSCHDQTLTRRSRTLTKTITYPNLSRKSLPRKYTQFNAKKQKLGRRSTRSEQRSCKSLGSRPSIVARFSSEQAKNCFGRVYLLPLSAARSTLRAAKWSSRSRIL